MPAYKVAVLTSIIEQTRLSQKVLACVQPGLSISGIEFPTNVQVLGEILKGGGISLAIIDAKALNKTTKSEELKTLRSLFDGDIILIDDVRRSDRVFDITYAKDADALPSVIRGLYEKIGEG